MKYLDKYKVTYVIVPGKDSVTVLMKVIGRKRDHSGNLVGMLNNKHILEKIISEL